MGNSDSKQPDQSSATASGGGGKDRVILNVYEPAERQQRSMPGFGIFHSGVEVQGTEYTFAGDRESGPGTGVISHRPRNLPPGSPWIFHKSVDLGPLKVDYNKFNEILRQLQSDFPANTYDLLARNCNHFSEAFTTRLGLSFPAWVNRAAKVGNNFRDLAGQGAAPSAPPPAAPVKSVFESTPGYSMVESGKSKSKSSSQSGSAPVRSASGSSAASSGQRKNPWRDPEFFPGKKPSSPSSPLSPGDQPVADQR